MKTTNMITMKTLYILVAFLGLQFNTIFAAGDNIATGSANESVSSLITTSLMPVVPLEATFEDVAEASTMNIDMSVLTPAVPMTADFSDGAPATDYTLINLAPVTPKEASFEDDQETRDASSIEELTPATPAVADFEDQV